MDNNGSSSLVKFNTRIYNEGGVISWLNSKLTLIPPVLCVKVKICKLINHWFILEKICQTQKTHSSQIYFLWHILILNLRILSQKSSSLFWLFALSQLSSIKKYDFLSLLSNLNSCLTIILARLLWAKGVRSRVRQSWKAMLTSNESFLLHLFLCLSFLEKAVGLLLSAAICGVILTNGTKHWGRGQGFNHLWSNCKGNIQACKISAWRCQERNYLLFLTLTVIRWCPAPGAQTPATRCAMHLYLAPSYAYLTTLLFHKISRFTACLSNTLRLGFHGAIGWSPGSGAIKIGSQTHLCHARPLGLADSGTRYTYWCLLAAGVPWKCHKTWSSVLWVLQRIHHLFKIVLKDETFMRNISN